MPVDIFCDDDRFIHQHPQRDQSSEKCQHIETVADQISRYQCDHKTRRYTDDNHQSNPEIDTQKERQKDQNQPKKDIGRDQIEPVFDPDRSICVGIYLHLRIVFGKRFEHRPDLPAQCDGIPLFGLADIDRDIFLSVKVRDFTGLTQSERDRGDIPQPHISAADREQLIFECLGTLLSIDRRNIEVAAALLDRADWKDRTESVDRLIDGTLGQPESFQLLLIDLDQDFIVGISAYQYPTEIFIAA